MKVIKGNIPTMKGPADWFTGDVYVDGIRQADEQSAVGVAMVRFTPGARTAWHTHPKGQTLYVTSGVGFVCNKGEEPREIRAGDSVFIEPGEVHWHGASPKQFMEHVALQESDENGQPVTWLDHVTDEEYAEGK